MLRSSNPILSKQDAFTPAAPQNQQYGQSPQYGQNPYAQQQGYGQPPVSTEPKMTFDDVITKTAAVMGLLVVSAALAWMLVPPALYMPAMILSALV
ncbi:MAG: Bax inhibitor-1/YccA family protein, partial [Microlunatus sp.]|nr:Bax inhibitor-1/YccA family protein [Microlunatus sp.]